MISYMEKLSCRECGQFYEVDVPKFCSRKCFHSNYGKNHRAENHYKWKGESVKYHGIHTWLRKFFGVSGICDICNKESKKLHWALMRGKEYERKRENFMHLCASCHKNYDMTIETRKRMSMAKIGKPSNRRHSL
jgi:hypothetical protein